MIGNLCEWYYASSLPAVVSTNATTSTVSGKLVEAQCLQIYFNGEVTFCIL